MPPPPNQYETAVMGSLPPPPGLYDDDGAPPAPQEEYLLSLDAGTSSIKAAVIEVRNSGERRVVSFSIESLPPPAAVAGIAGSSEQDAEAWWAAATRAIQRAVAAQPVQAVALSGQMQSVVLLDGAGAPLRPALLYSDTRATAEAAALVASLGVERLRGEAINWKGAASTLPKLLWLLAHEADAVGGAAAVALSAHDFLYRRLTGVGATDPTNASTTGLLAAGGEDGWAAPLLADAGVPAALVAKLPPVRRGARLLAPLSAAAAAALGGALAEGTPVCLGAGDLGTTTVGALGSGGGRAVGAPSTYCYLGTSGWVATVGDANPEADDDDDDIDCFEVVHPLPGRRILAAPMTTAGGNVRWLCGLLWPELRRRRRARARRGGGGGGARRLQRAALLAVPERRALPRRRPARARVLRRHGCGYESRRHVPRRPRGHLLRRPLAAAFTARGAGGVRRARRRRRRAAGADRHRRGAPPPGAGGDRRAARRLV